MGTTTRRRRAGRAEYVGLLQLLRQEETILRNRRQILRDGLPGWMAGVMDDEEHSLDAEGQRVGFSVLELTSRTVQGIEAALQRLEAGAFGMCLSCRRPISDLRLRAVPFAALCLACQET
jgi:RNA polymerase-binding transcription factor DksA